MQLHSGSILVNRRLWLTAGVRRDASLLALLAPIPFSAPLLVLQLALLMRRLP